MKNIYCYLIAGFTVALFIACPKKIHALKSRIKPTASVAVVGSYTSYSSAKLLRPQRSIIVTFKNMTNAVKVSYELSYSSNGITQGAAGSVAPQGNQETRSLYFGTCSHGVCTPHTNISNAVLYIRTYLQNGGRNVKRYRIKY